MKRSEINAALKEMEEMVKEYRFARCVRDRYCLS